MTLYVPPHFREDDPQALYRFIEEHAFATLVSAGPAGLHVSHVPFLPERGEDGRVRLLAHVARANPHWQALEQAEHVVAIFHGPHAYVSPTWYSAHPAVPTWNYAVVHAHGRAKLLEEPELHDLLLRLSSGYEAPNTPPWKMSALPADFTTSMLGAIVGFAIEVERLEGKFKLSQNRPADAAHVADVLESHGEAELATLMRANLPTSKV
ncbi:MAG TPA: FMN-binding negative transcriptional regulator [Usitatibacter sp.]|jgi:transcriptional regulator|nr:FMN-binding negative transcriptional regulator [Usitatibacter sp.]